MDIIMPIIIMLVGIVFPIYVAVRAGRRGHYGWAWGTGLALPILWAIAIVMFPEGAADNTIGSLILFSPVLVALVALRKTAKPVAPPVECPECGKSGGARGRVTLDQETGEKVPSKTKGISLLVSGLVCFALCLWFLIGALTWTGPGTLNVGVIAPVSVAGILLARSGIKILTQRPASTVKGMKYKCGTCKHNWTQ